MAFARTQIDVKVDGRCWAACHVYPDRGPILSAYTPTASLTICGWDSTADPGVELAFAEELLAAVRTYRNELHAKAQTPGTEQGLERDLEQDPDQLLLDGELS